MTDTAATPPWGDHPVPPEPDPAALRAGRLNRLREEILRRDLAACVLIDPVNIRYACGARNMQVFCSRNPARHLFVPAEGPVILFDFDGCEHLTAGLETLDEVRPSITASFAAAGPRVGEAERRWAETMGELVAAHGGGNRRVGIERVNAGAALALAERGFELHDAQDPVERARARKSPEELDVIRRGIAAVAEGEARLREALAPGITENALWATLHKHVVEADGDYIETRLLNSGPNTNPWFQETSPRAIQAGELVAHDTDVVGPGGYYVDFSRTFLCGDAEPTPEQRKLYRLSHEQIEHNIAILKPGMTAREIAEAAWPIPEPYVRNRYFVLMHGVGMTGEYPYIPHPMDLDAGYDSTIEPGMTLCIESFIGHEDGGEGVKLEEQVLITESGVERLSRFPYEERLLGREI